MDVAGVSLLGVAGNTTMRRRLLSLQQLQVFLCLLADYVHSLKFMFPVASCVRVQLSSCYRWRSRDGTWTLFQRSSSSRERLSISISTEASALLQTINLPYARCTVIFFRRSSAFLACHDGQAYCCFGRESHFPPVYFWLSRPHEPASLPL